MFIDGKQSGVSRNNYVVDNFQCDWTGVKLDSTCPRPTGSVFLCRPVTLEALCVVGLPRVSLEFAFRDPSHDYQNHSCVSEVGNVS